MQRILLLSALTSVMTLTAFAQNQDGRLQFDDPTLLIRTGSNQQEALEVADGVFQAVGFGNTFMVTTEAGNVIIDTSLPFNAARHKALLEAKNDGPVKYIILTHGHGDHVGGVSAWLEDGTEVIAQEDYAEQDHYQTRLAGYFARQNAAQFAGRIPAAVAEPNPGNFAAELEPTIFFDEEYRFELGGLTFEIYHAPGETYDHLAVWIPEKEIAFVGDNYYESFPNMYTLRGTKPRWALDYVTSLDMIMKLEPEIVAPSHGMPVNGAEEVQRRLTQYRDAILYVHDATVKGMNEGKDVYTLMREIQLPPELDVGEGYGKVYWSVRGIYEGYVGWFDGNVSTMYPVSPEAVHPDLVKLAGGADAVAELARKQLAAGAPVEAMHLTDAALNAEPGNKAALQVRLDALNALAEASCNSNEVGWLRHGIAEVTAQLEQP